MKYFILFLIIFLSFNEITAQDENQKNWMQLSFDNNYNASLFKSEIKDVINFQKPSFSLGIEQYFNSNFNFSVDLSLGKVYETSAITIGAEETKHSIVNFLDLEFSSVFKFNNGVILPKEGKIAPFIEAGIGLISFNQNIDQEKSGVTFLLPIAAGVRYSISDNLKFSAKIANNYSPKYNFSRLSIGFLFNLNPSLDSDEDGLLDADDFCPNEFGPIDNDGCPYIDSDKDGFFDPVDSCPFIAGKLFGCPDLDLDSIPDHQDKCPNLFGSILFSGCPDTDLDGVPDNLDKCPLLNGLIDLDGCPDRDSDGVADNKDKCPDVFGLTSLMGCPDIDKDGVADISNLQSTLNGEIRNRGLIINILPLEKIYFDYNKSSIDKYYPELLLQLVTFLEQNKSLIIEINGYTDNVGNDIQNQILSLNRSKAVKAFLLSKGANENQLIVHGYGKKNPIASNETIHSRAENRRVEIIIAQKP